MYHLATIHSIADRQIYDTIVPIADHTACSSTIGWWSNIFADVVR